MGFWDNVFNAVGFFTPRVQYYGARSEELDALFGYAKNMTVTQLWKSQPHLRTVVSFLARNTAQLKVHVYRRTGEDSRERDRTSPLAQLLAKPNPGMTGFDLIYSLVGDKKLYDRAYWWKRQMGDGSTQLWRIPPNWISLEPANVFEVDHYLVTNFKGNPIKVPVEEILAFGGYHPTDPLAGSPAVEALRDILNEQVQASLYRGQVWKNAGRVSAVLERPIGAKWSEGARNAFREDWYAKWTGSGSRAGGTPILEDGMTLKRIDFSAQEQQFVENAKLAMTQVAGVFHVNPTMVGVLDNANYSNVKEFRKALYAETLGPDLVEYQERMNQFLLPMLGMDPAEYYVEFNVQQKLQGDFEEQAQSMNLAIGRPWMKVDEGRARLNLPATDTGDMLAIPMAVSLEGMAPEPPDEIEPPEEPEAASELPKGLPPGRHPGRGVKERAGASYHMKYLELLHKHFRRQRASVKSRLGASKSEWWDRDRWNRELAHDLGGWSLGLTEVVATDVLKAAGVEASAYDVDRTKAWVTKVSKHSAENINAKTEQAIAELIEDGVEGEEAEEALDALFGDGRAELLAIAAVTTMSAFATQEAGKQGGAATKTWITGPNPRPEHAAMDGETVGINDNFSNGLAWPGDASGSVDDLAGCNCDLQMNWE